MKEKIIEALMLIAKEIVEVWYKSLTEYNIQSFAEYKTEVKFPDIEFIYPQYFDYVESGRRPKVRKVPINALIEWAKKRNIPTDNSTLYAIQQSIYNNGISPRPITDLFSDNLEKNWDEWSLIIFNKFSEELERIWQSL